MPVFSIMKAYEFFLKLRFVVLLWHNNKFSYFIIIFISHHCYSYILPQHFNTLKNDLIHEHSYKTEDELYRSIEEYAYVTYNHARPHSYNGYKTPFEARYIA